MVNDHYFPKRVANAFANRDLDAFLRTHGVARVILAGVFAHACVRATARGALRLGYRVAALEDGVATTGERRRTAALSRLQQMGAEIVTSEQMLSSAGGASPGRS